MAKITATGVPVKYPELGDIKICISGDEVSIQDSSIQRKMDGKYIRDAELVELLKHDLKRGPSYPLCAEPFTMRCALFVLFEWFGEAESCWIEEPKHVILEGEIEPMPNDPDVIY